MAREFASNQKEETFSGLSFILSSTEMGLSWLELEVNTKIELGNVNWSIQD